VPKDRPASDKNTPKTIANLSRSIGNATLGVASDTLPDYRPTEHSTKFGFKLVAVSQKATKQQIRDEMRALYGAKEDACEKMPNINETAKAVRERLEKRNLLATQTLIKSIADETEFKNRRGRVGVRRNNKGLPRQRSSK
jgi:ribosomal protein L23